MEEQKTLTIEERLKTIENLRLLYNTKEELHNFVGINPNNNNSLARKGGNDQFLKRAIYHELAFEALERTGMQIDEVLDDYEEINSLFDCHLKKNKSKAQYEFNVKICETLCEVFAYNKPMANIEEPEIQEICKKAFDEEDNTTKTDIAMLILLLLGIIPRKGQNGDVKDIVGDCGKLYNFFLKLPYEEERMLIKEPPRLDLLKQIIENKDENVCRLDLIRLCREVIFNLKTISSSEDFKDVTKWMEDNMLYPQMDGYWLADNHKAGDGDAWLIEERCNAYVFTHFSKDKKKESFAASIYFEADSLKMYISHPKNIKELIEKKQFNREYMMYLSIDMDNIDTPDQITISPFMLKKNWFNINKLRRVTDEGEIEYLKSTTANYTDKFADDDYSFTISAAAITHRYVYVEDNERECTYKVPVELYPKIEGCNIDDIIGIIKLKDKRYIGFQNLNLYIDVTSKKDCDESEIIIVENKNIILE